MWLYWKSQGDARHQSPASIANPEPDSTITSPSHCSGWIRSCNARTTSALSRLLPHPLLSFAGATIWTLKKCRNRITTKNTQLAVCSWLYNAVIVLSLILLIPWMHPSQIGTGPLDILVLPLYLLCRDCHWSKWLPQVSQFYQWIKE